jgi:D-sedoheptulose 7-phosphate isomerase/D-glycero-D-manno-heptose 1,7-bisphosphate phosphatase
MPTIALTGFEGDRHAGWRRLVHVDSHNYGVVEDAHQSCMHLLRSS